MRKKKIKECTKEKKKEIKTIGEKKKCHKGTMQGGR
jgi:hypothetical protein